MKNTLINISKAFAILLLVGISFSSFAQPADPPGDNDGSNNMTPGGGAPIGGGIIILLSLGAAYGGRKVYQSFEEGTEV